MKKLFALFFVGLSGLYLLVAGPMPDPIPFLDEGMALIVFVNSLAFLGLDLRRFVGMGKKKDNMRKTKGAVVDEE